MISSTVKDIQIVGWKDKQLSFMSLAPQGPSAPQFPDHGREVFLSPKYCFLPKIPSPCCHVPRSCPIESPPTRVFPLGNSHFQRDRRVANSLFAFHVYLSDDICICSKYNKARTMYLQIATLVCYRLYDLTTPRSLNIF